MVVVVVVKYVHVEYSVFSKIPETLNYFENGLLKN